MELKTHKHKDTIAHVPAQRSCQLLCVTWLYTHTHKDPRGTGSNEDTGLEQGYHNKLSSMFALGYTQLPHSSYQMKRILGSRTGYRRLACNLPLRRKMKKGWGEKCIKQLFETYSTFYSCQRELAKAFVRTHQLAGSILKPKHQNCGFYFPRQLTEIKMIQCNLPFLIRKGATFLSCMGKYVCHSIQLVPTLPLECYSLKRDKHGETNYPTTWISNGRFTFSPPTLTDIYGARAKAL